MIPKFPSFKQIELSDREAVEFYTLSTASYSDFNFTSLWIWDQDNKREISELNNNLVVIFTDYQTGESVLSFLGENMVDETATSLLSYAEANGLTPFLKYIPSETADLITSNNLKVTEDEDNHDYILLTQKISNLAGNELKSKRRLAQKFFEKYPKSVFKTGNLIDIDIYSKVERLFENWNNNSHQTCDEKEELSHVLARLLKHPPYKKFIFSFLTENNKVIAFAADEILTKNTAISHFVTADTSYAGVYEYFNSLTATELLRHGCTHWNWEQDLGIPSLKAAKNSYRPETRLKKYKIEFTKNIDLNFLNI